MTEASHSPFPIPNSLLQVACVSPSAALGGSEWSLLDFARRAAANDINAVVLLPKTGPLETALREAGVMVGIAEAPASLLSLTQRGLPGPGDLLALTKGLRQWAKSIETEAQRLFDPPIPRSPGPPIWYSNGFKAHLACALLKGKHVWHLREFPPGKVGIAWKLIAGAVPTSTIANSRAVADAWALLGWKRPVTVLNGVDLERFKPAPPTGWLHEALGIEPDATLIGMPAVLARWKGQLQVVAAFERVAAELPKVHLVLAGGAIYDSTAERGFAEELVRRVRGTSLTDRIHFFKHQSEPWKLYPEFQFVVHFSTRPEPFGRVIAESLASGVPAIAARAGGPMEIVEHGVTGWLVPTGDIAALGGAMKVAIGAAPGMRAACRRAAEERFGADRYAAEVARALRAT